MATRSNDEWVAALSTPSPARDAALDDLREILLNGLQRGLLGRVDTRAPEFHTQAEDFVQEALLKILDNLASFAGRSLFTTWAHKIAVHSALTELRRKRWQDSSLDRLTERDGREYTPDFTAAPGPEPDSALAQNDMLERVNRLIEEGLTERQRTAIQAAIIQGKTTNQLAAELNLKPNAVYKLLHDARLRLKRLLAEEGLSASDVYAVFE